jgi:hypothetical protein
MLWHPQIILSSPYILPLVIVLIALYISPNSNQLSVLCCTIVCAFTSQGLSSVLDASILHNYDPQTAESGDRHLSTVAKYCSLSHLSANCDWFVYLLSFRQAVRRSKLKTATDHQCPAVVVDLLRDTTSNGAYTMQ